MVGAMFGALRTPGEPRRRGRSDTAHPHNLRVFVFFVVIPPLTSPERLEGFFYHEEHEGHEEGLFWGEP